LHRATLVLRKINAAGQPVRQIELCDRHAEAVIAREHKRGFEMRDRPAASLPALAVVFRALALQGGVGLSASLIRGF
jgi:hypothetical protein